MIPNLRNVIFHGFYYDIFTRRDRNQTKQKFYSKIINPSTLFEATSAFLLNSTGLYFFSSEKTLSYFLLKRGVRRVGFTCMMEILRHLKEPPRIKHFGTRVFMRIEIYLV